MENNRWHERMRRAWNDGRRSVQLWREAKVRFDAVEADVNRRGMLTR